MARPDTNRTVSWPTGLYRLVRIQTATLTPQNPSPGTRQRTAVESLAILDAGERIADSVMRRSKKKSFTDQRGILATADEALTPTGEGQTPSYKTPKAGVLANTDLPMAEPPRIVPRQCETPLR